MHWFICFQKAAHFFVHSCAVFCVFRCVFLGIWPQDHHNQHRLARAVILVVSICQTELWGESYECFTFLGVFCLVISPQDHHFRHRLDQAVLMVVQFCSVKFCGNSYEVFFEKLVF